MSTLTCARCGGTGLEPDSKAIARDLKARREKAGITQEQMAEACGISQSYVSYLETGMFEWTATMRRLFEAALRKKR